MISIELTCKSCGKTYEAALFTGQVCTHCGHNKSEKDKGE